MKRILTIVLGVGLAAVSLAFAQIRIQNNHDYFEATQLSGIRARLIGLSDDGRVMIDPDGLGVTALNFDNIRLCSGFPGATAWDKIVACIADLPATGGVADARGLLGAQAVASVITITKSNVTLLLGAATYAFSGAGQIVLSSGVTNFHIKGSGGSSVGATRINHASTNCWVDLAADLVANGVWIEDLFINTTSTSASACAIRVGRTTEAFNPNAFRTDWLLRNLVIVGPGPSNAGTIGVTLSQMGRGLIEHVRVQGYETDWIMASTTENWLIGVTLDTFLFGIQTIALSGAPATGDNRDRILGMAMHGPSTGTTGIPISINTRGNIVNGIYVETQVTTAGAIASFGANAVGNQFYSASYDYTGGNTGGIPNHYIFAAGASRNVFFGDTAHLTTGSLPPISMASPGTFSLTSSNRNIWWEADDNTQSALVTPIANGYATSCSHLGSSPRCDPGLGIGATVPAGMVAYIRADTGNTGLGVVPQLVLNNSDNTANNWAMLGFSPLAAGTITAGVATHFVNRGTNVPDICLATFDGSTTACNFTLRGADKSIVWNGGTNIVKHLSTTASLDFAAFAGSGVCQNLNVTLTGAADGDEASVAPGITLGSVTDVQFTAIASADTVTVRGCKNSVGASADPAPATVRVTINKH